MIMYGFLILSLLITLSAQIYLKIVYGKYEDIKNSAGLTGAEAARQMLDEHGLTHVQIEKIGGELTDHFDPAANVIRLSQKVYDGKSVAAIGVAMHECGHAVQLSEQYFPFRVRHAIVRTTNISSYLSYFLVMLGVVFSSYNLMTVGIWFFCAVVLFQLVTLPVEFNASGRAIRTLRAMPLAAEDSKGAAKVLRAAAMTYVAAFVVSLLQLLRLLAIRGRRR